MVWYPLGYAHCRWVNRVHCPYFENAFLGLPSHELSSTYVVCERSFIFSIRTAALISKSGISEVIQHGVVDIITKWTRNKPSCDIFLTNFCVRKCHRDWVPAELPSTACDAFAMLTNVKAKSAAFTTVGASFTHVCCRKVWRRPGKLIMYFQPISALFKVCMISGDAWRLLPFRHVWLPFVSLWICLLETICERVVKIASHGDKCELESFLSEVKDFL